MLKVSTWTMWDTVNFTVDFFWSAKIRGENATEAIFENVMTKKMPQIEEAHRFKKVRINI